MMTPIRIRELKRRQENFRAKLEKTQPQNFTLIKNYDRARALQQLALRRSERLLAEAVARHGSRQAARAARAGRASASAAATIAADPFSLCFQRMERDLESSLAEV